MTAAAPLALQVAGVLGAAAAPAAAAAVVGLLQAAAAAAAAAAVGAPQMLLAAEAHAVQPPAAAPAAARAVTAARRAAKTLVKSGSRTAGSRAAGSSGSHNSVTAATAVPKRPGPGTPATHLLVVHRPWRRGGARAVRGRARPHAAAVGLGVEQAVHQTSQPLAHTRRLPCLAFPRPAALRLLLRGGVWPRSLLLLAARRAVGCLGLLGRLQGALAAGGRALGRCRRCALTGRATSSCIGGAAAGCLLRRRCSGGTCAC